MDLLTFVVKPTNAIVADILDQLEFASLVRELPRTESADALEMHGVQLEDPGASLLWIYGCQKLAEPARVLRLVTPESKAAACAKEMNP